MNPLVKLAAFAVALALVFVTGLVVGAAVDPDVDRPAPAEHPEHES